MAGRAGSAAGGPPASLIGKSVASASGGAADEDDDDAMTSASRLQQLKKARGARARARAHARAPHLDLALAAPLARARRPVPPTRADAAERPLPLPTPLCALQAALDVFQLMALERTLGLAPFYALHAFGLLQLLVMPLSPSPTMPWRPGTVAIANRVGGSVDIVAAFHSFLLNGACVAKGGRARARARASRFVPAPHRAPAPGARTASFRLQ